MTPTTSTGARVAVRFRGSAIQSDHGRGAQSRHGAFATERGHGAAAHLAKPDDRCGEIGPLRLRDPLFELPPRRLRVRLLSTDKWIRSLSTAATTTTPPPTIATTAATAATAATAVTAATTATTATTVAPASPHPPEASGYALHVGVDDDPGAIVPERYGATEEGDGETGELRRRRGEGEEVRVSIVEKEKGERGRRGVRG